jgi:hypothetical protein
MTATDGYVVGTTKVVDHGPESLRWDLVILGDGYQASELAIYHQDVENFLAELRATPPFDELFCGINVHRVDIVSTDSGADSPTTAGDCSAGSTSVRTFLDAKFCSLWNGAPLERLLTVDSTRALAIATAAVPLRNQVLVIVNSSKYGGSGGEVATCSTGSSAAKIAIHEIGHSAFGLADEYGGNGTGTPAGEPSQPNMTRDTNRATNKWRDLVAATTPMPSACDGSCTSSTCVAPAAPPPPGAVGTYEGGIYSDCNTYRPLPSCYMRDYSPFCPVCARVIRQVLAPFQPAESINLVTPSIAFTDVPAGLGGVGVTTHRAIVFEVVACRTLHFTIVAGPTGGFGTPQGTSVAVGADPILPVASARLWLSYTSTMAGDSASGSVTVRCTETAQEWVINIVANTISRPRTAVSLVLDRSYSMTEDAGDAVQKIQKLRESCDDFIGLLLPTDGIGVVRFNQAAQRLQEITDGGGAAAIATINGASLDPAGATSIGDGVLKGRDMLNDGQAATADPYDVQAMVVLTDGQWNTAPSLATVSGSINAHTFAVGLGLPSNISVGALDTLCQGHGGFLLVTGAITSDQSMRLSKYFLQILAGITNAQIAADPAGVLDVTATHRIPFWMSEADYGMDVIVLSPYPKVIDFQLEAPDGTRIDPSSGPGGANSAYQVNRHSAFYRCALPVLPWDPAVSHGGLWHAVLTLGGRRAGSIESSARANDNAAYYDPKRAVLPYELVVHTHSSLTFQATAAQASYDLGAEVQLVATLAEYAVPIGDRASVWAEVRRPDGSADAVGLDLNASHRFTATYRLDQAGVYSMRVRAHGTTSDGTPFDRERTLTATAVPGGDRRDPTDPGRDPWCELVECLTEHGVLGDRLREWCKRLGIDFDGLMECVRGACRPGAGEDPRTRPGSKSSPATPSRDQLVELVARLRAELGV